MGPVKRRNKGRKNAWKRRKKLAYHKMISEIENMISKNKIERKKEVINLILDLSTDPTINPMLALSRINSLVSGELCG